jgi:hypothetical protein
MDLSAGGSFEPGSFPHARSSVCSLVLGFVLSLLGSILLFVGQLGGFASKVSMDLLV